MKQIIQTESGSTYIIDLETQRWERSSDHDVIGLPGINGEQLREMPEITVGQRMLLVAPSGVWVSTSPVKETWIE